jgi:uncharacterized membrane protein YkgB
MKKQVETIDLQLITFFQKIGVPFARISLFIVYFWFGVLKLINVSPANPLVEDLLHKTLPFLTFDQFIATFAVFEMVIGILFLIPKAVRIVLPLLAVHMITTFLPLILLPLWTSAFVPTLEGQYIIKNLIIIALAMTIASNLKPINQK